MKALPMRDLMARIVGEWAAKGSAYDIPAIAVKRILETEAASPGFKVNGLPIGIPIGPAAGPHTQIAPNLVAAWLAGSRVFELKTVQENDALDIEKPCIDALDEGHNVEWSTELTLDEARAEYLRGWIAIQILRAALCEKPGNIMFNMSVGYTLDGIKGSRMDAFIEGLRRPAGTGIWETALAEARTAVDGPAFDQAFGPTGAARARALVRDMPASPVHSVTLSTMHGCPPAEIERIGSYLIEEKGLDCYVKLNPTLLGYDTVREILDRCGWQRISLTRPTFEHDLQFDAALALLASLRAKAQARGTAFGVKLSNTLANINDGGRLPGGERYMSGRALFPITVRLAADLAAALPASLADLATRPLAFSYCGGASAHNAAACLMAGLGPLTVATDILKPGGYLRLEPMAREAVRAIQAGVPDAPDAGRLAALASAALADRAMRGDYKTGQTAINKPLPVTDCFAAPCVEACPANQKAPAYMKTLASGDARQALAIVLADNPLPFITGVLCDHQCMTACARVDYEGPVAIRDMKLACARAATIRPVARTRVTDKGRTAVFGAGPAGLACAHYLALEGYPVTVFDRADQAGGVPAGVIPAFRIAREDIAADILRIKELGAEFSFGWSGSIDQAALKAAGYTSIVVATGAPVARQLPLAGSGIPVLDALDFLESAHHGTGYFAPGATTLRSVVVAGGGNTAMDAARVAVRLPGQPAVAILYRRTLAEMPADREEFEAALADGVAYHELALPEAAAPAAAAAAVTPAAATSGAGTLPTLTVRTMVLGQADASGRRSPVASDHSQTMPCDLIVAAVGEMPDGRLLSSLGITIKSDGRPEADPWTMAAGQGIYVAGDARRGPSSIIAAAADGRKAAYAILRAAGIEPTIQKFLPQAPDPVVLSRRGELLPAASPADPDFARREAERCLSCGSACLRCVEVCPNRANFAMPVRVDGTFKQAIQILHVDALCNECGNCGFFCPYDGRPYQGKPTLFQSERELKASGNPGFAFIGPAAKPNLAMRIDPGSSVPVTHLAHADWLAAASLGSSIALMARTVLREHAYLIGGGQV